MRADEVMGVDDRPDIFPLPAEDHTHFATAGKEIFGWSRGGEEFHLSRQRWSGGLQVVSQWPLTEDGWEQAWRHIAMELPNLATAILTAWEKTAVIRDAQLRRAENRTALEAEGQLEALAGCVFLGGYGVEPGLTPGEKADVYFTHAGIWLSKAGGYKPYLRRSYEASHGLEFEGGAVQSGGGYRGFGFGLMGAAEGIAIASLLNSLTSKTTVHTAVRFEADDAEVFFFTDQAVPRVLEMRFAEVRGRIKAGTRTPAAQETPSTADFTDRLIRLSEMLDKGHLTEEEFAVAKARLLNETT
jgi:hypothetical protein